MPEAISSFLDLSVRRSFSPQARSFADGKAREPEECYPGEASNKKGGKNQKGPGARIMGTTQMHKRGSKPKCDDVAEKVKEQGGKNGLGKVGKKAVDAAGSKVEEAVAGEGRNTMGQVDQYKEQ